MLLPISKESGKLALYLFIRLAETYLRGVDPDDAVPARATDLGALPPAWIGVGTRDLLFNECLEEQDAHSLRAGPSGMIVGQHGDDRQGRDGHDD